MFLNLLCFYELSELWGGATSICDGNFFLTPSLKGKCESWFKIFMIHTSFTRFCVLFTECIFEASGVTRCSFSVLPPISSSVLPDMRGLPSQHPGAGFITNEIAFCKLLGGTFQKFVLIVLKCSVTLSLDILAYQCIAMLL